MAVIGIIALVTSLSLGMLQGSQASLSAEGNQITDLVGFAQQTAIGKNRATALVVAQMTSGEQAFGIFQLSPADSSVPAVSGDWRQVIPWKFLPAGVALENNSSTSTFLTSPHVSPALQIDRVGGREVGSFAYQVFLPGNQLVTSSGATSFPTLRLVEGAYQNGTFVSRRKGTANFYDILINPATGRAIVERP